MVWRAVSWRSYGFEGVSTPCWDFSLERKKQYLGTRVGSGVVGGQSPHSLCGWELKESSCLILTEPWPSANSLKQALAGRGWS